MAARLRSREVWIHGRDYHRPMPVFGSSRQSAPIRRNHAVVQLAALSHGPLNCGHNSLDVLYSFLLSYGHGQGWQWI